MAAQNHEDQTTFDIGSADEIAVCTSCHMGGGAYEVDRNGNRYDEFYKNNAQALADGSLGKMNGDYFRHDLDVISSAPLNFMMDAMGGPATPSLTAPKLHDWDESGVLEAECLTCHLDPFKDRLTTIDGVPVQNYAPQLLNFVVAKMRDVDGDGVRDDYEDIYAISYGRYPDTANPSEVPAGYEVFALDRYSSPLSTDVAYQPGGFYSALNTPAGSSRDMLKSPIVEGGWPDEAGGRNGFRMHNGYRPNFNVIDDQGDKVWGSRKFLGYYFKYAATGGLSGLDLDGDGIPLAYVRLVKKPGVALDQIAPSHRPEAEVVQNYFTAETYYDPEDLALFAAVGSDATSAPILGSNDTGGQKWDIICGRCHVAFTDPIDKVVYFRPSHMGMKADVPKRGTFWKMDYTDAEDYTALKADVESHKKSRSELAGYDVHAAKGVECVDCHAARDGTAANANHNFGKGIDTGGTVRNDLDYTRVKLCTDCHQTEQMLLAHRANFGTEANVAEHFEQLSCEACHVPEKRFWAFRAFDYSLGFAYNFDSRFMPNPYDPGNLDAMMPFSMMPPEYNIADPQPGYYGTAPNYGIGGLVWAGQNVPLYGMDVLTTIAYFDPRGPEPLEAAQVYLKTGEMPPFYDPSRKMDPYAMFYNMMTDMDGHQDKSDPMSFAASANGRNYFNMVPVLYRKPGPDGKIKLYPGNPVAVITWAEFENDAFKKVIYPRELNSILMGAVSEEVYPGGPHHMGIVVQGSGLMPQPDGSFVITPENRHLVIWDDNMDLRPEISNEAEIDLVRNALELVLDREDALAGRPAVDRDLRMTIAAHYFTITHNILPGSEALGAKKDYDPMGGLNMMGQMIPAPGNVAAGKVAQCVDCHADAAPDALPPGKSGDPDLMMNARLTNRRVNIIPWPIQGLGGENGLLSKKKVWIEDEIAHYVEPMDGNGNGTVDDMPDFSHVNPTGDDGYVIPGDFIGARQDHIIEGTLEAAEAFAHMAGLTPTLPGEEPAEKPDPAPAEPTGKTGCFLQMLLQ